MGDNEFSTSNSRHETAQELPPKTEILQKIIRLREAIEIAMKTLNAMLENNERTPQFQELELTIADLKITEQKLSVMVLAYPAEPHVAVAGAGENENTAEAERQGDDQPQAAIGPSEGGVTSNEAGASVADSDGKYEQVDTTKVSRRPAPNIEGASRRPVSSDHVSSSRDKNTPADSTKLRDHRDSESGGFVPVQNQSTQEIRQPQETRSTSGSDTRGASPERSKEAFLEHLQYIHANIESPSERMLTVLAGLRLFFSKEEAAEVAQDFFNIHETFWDLRRRPDINYLKQQCLQNPASAPDLLRTQGMNFGDLGPYYNNQFQDYPEMDDSFGDNAGGQGISGFDGEGRAPDYLMTHSDVMVNEIRAMPQPIQPDFARDEEMEVPQADGVVREPRSYSAFNLPSESDFTTHRNVNDERRESDKSSGLMYGELLDYERDFYRDSASASASKAQSRRDPFGDCATRDMLRDEIREFFIQNTGRSDAPESLYPNPVRTQKLRSMYYDLYKTKLRTNEKGNRPPSPYSPHVYGPEKDNDSSRNSGLTSKLAEKDGDSRTRPDAGDLDYLLNLKARLEGSRQDLSHEHINRPRGYGNNLSGLPNYDHTSGDHTADRQQGRSSANPVAGPSQQIPGPSRKGVRYANCGKDAYLFDADSRFSHPSDSARNNTPPRESQSSSGPFSWSHDRGDRGESQSSNHETLKQLIALLDGQRRQIANAESVMRQNAVKITRLERELRDLRSRNLELERHVYNHRYMTARTAPDRYVNTSNLSNDALPRREMPADYYDFLLNQPRDMAGFDRLVGYLPMNDNIPRNNSSAGPSGNSTFGNGIANRPFTMRSLSHLNGSNGSITARDSGLSEGPDQRPGYSGASSDPQRNQTSMKNGILNNQVPPGNRANNYWDNFRSYSRQNLLSSPKFNGSLNAPSGTSDLRMRGADEVNNFNTRSSTNKIHRPNTRVGKCSSTNSQQGKLFMGRHFVDNIPTKNRNEEEDSDEMEDEEEGSDEEQDRDRNRN